MDPARRHTRLVTIDDAPALAALLRANREFLAPWEPDRPDSFFTVEGQRWVIEDAQEQYARGLGVPHVIVDSGQVVGRITLNNVVRRAFLSCSVGYWVAREVNGRGLATAAVGEMKRIAFDELGLHRVEAGTLVHNVASQRVLERNGFVRFGMAPEYLAIAGRWQDHYLFQVLNDDRVPG